jgi:hypothetical protein
VLHFPPEHPEPARPWLRWFIAIVSLVAFLSIGYAIPRWLISSGLDHYVNDPAAFAVARMARADFYSLNATPIGQLLLPGSRIVRVWREPGHCAPSEPGGTEQNAQWRADVRTHGWFGIPVGTIHVRCGGWLY